MATSKAQAAPVPRKADAARRRTPYRAFRPTPRSNRGLSRRRHTSLGDSPAVSAATAKRATAARATPESATDAAGEPRATSVVARAMDKLAEAS